MTGQVWVEGELRTAALASTIRGDCLVLQTAPTPIAILACRVEQICDYRDWPEAELLPTLESLAGVVCAPSLDAGRRVLVLGGPEGPVGLSIPHTLSVLPATHSQLLPLPELFGGKVFSALLLWHGQPKALVIDCDRLRAQMLEELLRA